MLIVLGRHFHHRWLSGRRALKSLGPDGSTLLAAASAPVQTPALVPASNPRANNPDMRQSATWRPNRGERLLELPSPARPVSRLDHKNLDSWRGHLRDTGSALPISCLRSGPDDPRVRVAAVEIDLVANNLRKSPQGLANFSIKFITIPSAAISRSGDSAPSAIAALRPATVLSTLLRYSRDPNQQTRFWAVEGLAMLGTAESIDALLPFWPTIPPNEFVNARPCNLARSGMLTGEQRLTAFLNCSSSGRRFGRACDARPSFTRLCSPLPARRSAKDPGAWRDWWAHHDRPKTGSMSPRVFFFA